MNSSHYFRETNDAKRKGETLKSEHYHASNTADESHAKIERILNEAGVKTL